MTAMYSRDFSDRKPIVPPDYGGTAYRREREKKEDPPSPKRPPPQKEHPREEGCRENPPCHEEPCREEPPCREDTKDGSRGLLGRLLPFGIREEDLLLLGIALLLLLDGCEDRYLPYILLFLLIVH